MEQVPGKLVEDAYKNTNLKVMHRLPADDDRRLIGATMRFSDDQERYAASLAPFTVFAYHDGLDRPALVQVPDVRGEAARAAGLDRVPLLGDEPLAVRFRELAAAVPAIDAASPRSRSARAAATAARSGRAQPRRYARSTRRSSRPG